MQIAQGTLWRYVGSGDGKGHVHRIIEIGKNIVTWSIPSKDENEVGWSWYGPWQQFRQQFVPA